jgi:two-component system, NtrC family, nitrogen regulation sensor histidine kinase NtrY
MFYRSFFFALFIRITLLAVILAGAMYFFLKGQMSGGLAFTLLAFGSMFNLYYCVNDTNRRLARFFESVRYSDFAIRFSSGREKGGSFEQVNRQFNEVLEAFRQTRAEKETNLLFLNALVQHLSTGVLAFDAQSNVLISNNSAFQLLGVYRLHHLNDLPAKHRELSQFIRDLSTKGKILYQPETGQQLSVQGVFLNLQGRAVRLFTLQNIHTELQRKEVDAWRDLTRVLRHEMMNSFTPIVSLVETMQEIVKHDLPQDETANDLQEALEIVGDRSRSLMNFVDAYRNFTALPLPKIENIAAQKLLDRVAQLAINDLKTAEIALEVKVASDDLVLQADAGQLEMILLNLVKNAREAIVNHKKEGKPFIKLCAYNGHKGKPILEVVDNGPGIAAELLEEIFIPFFTTKETGTGVGLSISKQIMQLHGGDVRVESKVGVGTKFLLEF